MSSEKSRDNEVTKKILNKSGKEYKSEVMEAMEEAKLISNAESVKGYYNIDEAFEELKINDCKVTTNALQYCCEVKEMKKTATLNLRVNPSTKKRAEEILAQLGVPMATAIDMYLNQISLTGGIPFSVSLPDAPDSVNAELMTDAEIYERLKEGIDQAEQGKVYDAAEAFAALRRSISEEI